MKEIRMPTWLPLYVLLFSLLCRGNTCGNSHDINGLRDAFSKHLMSRNQYLDQLATLRFKIITSQEKTTAVEEAGLAAIDDEIRRNPTTPTDDKRSWSRLRIGKWESPRHDYLYRPDGTWTMLPIIPDVTCGRWKIEDNRYYDWIPKFSPKEDAYQIILLDGRYFIFTDGNHLFYEKRLSEFP